MCIVFDNVCMHVGLEDHMMFKLLILSTGITLLDHVILLLMYVYHVTIAMMMTLSIVSGQGL